MIFAGVDVGAATAKTVIFGDNSVLGHCIIPTGRNVKLAAGYHRSNGEGRNFKVYSL